MSHKGRVSVFAPFSTLSRGFEIGVIMLSPYSIIKDSERL
jgi:hypothetical protein